MRLNRADVKDSGRLSRDSSAIGGVAMAVVLVVLAATACTGGGSKPAAKATTTTVAVGPSNGAPRPPAQGTYRYRQSGQDVVGNQSQPTPGEGTLTVDAPRPDGNQVWHRRSAPNAPSVDTPVRFGDNGAFLLGTNSRGTTCPWDPPMPLLPWPVEVGQTFLTKTSCSGADLDVQGKIDSQRSVELDGRAIDVYVVTKAITTHGNLESTGTEVDWFAPSLGLNVHVESHSTGLAKNTTVQSDETDDLVSARPSRLS